MSEDMNNCGQETNLKFWTIVSSSVGGSAVGTILAYYLNGRVSTYLAFRTILYIILTLGIIHLLADIYLGDNVNLHLRVAAALLIIVIFCLFSKYGHLLITFF